MRPILFLLIVCLASPAPAGDGPAVMRFDLRILGLHAGTIDLAMTRTDAAYAARSRFRTAGLVSLFKRLRADVTVQGRIAGGALRPVSYSEAINDGDRVTDAEVRFVPGPPRLISGRTGSAAPPVDGDRLRDALDPLTGLYLALRDQPRDGLCRLSKDVFDGQRLARLVLDRRQAQGEAVLCHGAYQRLAGYDDDDEKGRSRRVPVTVEYRPRKGLMRAERVAFDTRYGPAVMARR